MEEQSEIPVVETSQRPQFITVLCILTFIGVAFGVIGSIVGWFSTQKMVDMVNNMPDQDFSSMPGMEDMGSKMELMVKWKNVNLIVGIVGSLLCLVGALQMWKLKRTGYFIYVVGEIVPIIITGILMGSVFFKGYQIIGLILPIVFVVLYSINLKYLK